MNTNGGKEMGDKRATTVEKRFVFIRG